MQAGARFEDVRYDDYDKPRFRRARRFSSIVQQMLRDFLPHGRECSRLIEDHLLRLGYELNLEIIEVPPECDALDKLQLEARMLETAHRISADTLARVNSGHLLDEPQLSTPFARSARPPD